MAEEKFSFAGSRVLRGASLKIERKKRKNEIKQ